MSPWLQTVWLLTAAVAAGLLPLQAGINATLARQVGHPMVAVVISFTIGTIMAVLVALALRVSWPGLAVIRNGPLWMWTGGTMGVAFVAVSIFVAPKIGAVAFAGTILGGQLVAGLLLDHFGVAGFGERPITLYRILGIVMIAGGVLLVQFAPGSAGSSMR